MSEKGQHFVTYYDNGQKMSEYICTKGKITGLAASWFPNGYIRSHTDYKDGKRHGTHREYHNNYQLKIEHRYINDVMTYSAEYNSNGISTGKQKHNILKTLLIRLLGQVNKII